MTKRFVADTEKAIRAEAGADCGSPTGDR